MLHSGLDGAEVGGTQLQQLLKGRCEVLEEGILVSRVNICDNMSKVRQKRHI